jgi:flagellar hook-basal body complex protein FliE
MEIGSVRGAGGLDPARLYGKLAAPAADAARTSFADTLRDALGEVNRLQGQRDDTVRAAVAGQVTDPHDVMVAVEESQLAFELLLEVRNRLLESYQEIMRLQV